MRPLNLLISTIAPPSAEPRLEPQPLWRGLPWVMALGLALRLLVTVVSKEIIHPDEIFQYLEQAHRLVFGYGFVPWEYVHGIRNWLLPMILALPLGVSHRLGMNDPHLYIPVIQTLACLVSLAAIFCAYWIGRRLWSESVGRIACVLTALWWELIFWAHKVTPEILGMYLLLAALACLASRPTWWGAVLFGVCGAGAMALRLQYAPAVAILMAVMLIFGVQRRWPISRVLLAALASMAVVLLVGWLDYYTWGGWWISYQNNYLYNSVYGVSSFFGEHSVLFYPLQLGLNSAGLFWIAITVALFRYPKQCWLPLVLIASIVVPHTLIPHKEYRFVTAVIPLGLLLLAILLSDLWQAWDSRGQGRRWRRPLTLGLTFYPLIGIVALFAFLNQDTGLQAYLYLNDQPQVVAILDLTDQWFGTGGYYYLHRDVPLYFAEDVESMAPDEWSNYFSHIISRVDQPVASGFTADTQIGDLVIQGAAAPPSQSLPADNRIPIQSGVTGVYEPRVTPRF